MDTTQSGIKSCRCVWRLCPTTATHADQSDPVQRPDEGEWNVHPKKNYDEWFERGYPHYGLVKHLRNMSGAIVLACRDTCDCSSDG